MPVSDTPGESRTVGSFLRHEWNLFLQHRAAYLALFVVKLGLFFIILRLHRASGIRGELLPAFVLSLVGIIMTVMFHRGASHASPPAKSTKSSGNQDVNARD